MSPKGYAAFFPSSTTFGYISFTKCECEYYQIKQNGRNAFFGPVPSMMHQRIGDFLQNATIKEKYWNDLKTLFIKMSENQEEREFRRSTESWRIEIIELSLSVIILLRTPRAVFIAVRGTVLTHYKDLKADLMPGLKEVVAIDPYYFFRRGFYDAAEQGYSFIQETLSDIFFRDLPPYGPPIYLTGHSLGGAIAGIYLALADGKLNGHTFFNANIDFKSCYTFGMPRYGNSELMRIARNPYHIFNIKDPVPFIPSEIWGWANCTNEHQINEKKGNIYELKYRNDPILIKYVANLFLKLHFRHHFIDSYNNLLTPNRLNIV